MNYDAYEIHHGNEFSLYFKPSAYIVRISGLTLDICCPTGTYALRSRRPGRFCTYDNFYKLHFALNVSLKEQHTRGKISSCYFPSNTDAYLLIEMRFCFNGAALSSVITVCKDDENVRRRSLFYKTVVRQKVKYV